MAWKERHAPESAGLARLVILVGMVAVVHAVQFFFLRNQAFRDLAFDEMFAYGLDIGPWGAHGVYRTGLNYVLCEQAAILYFASLVASTILAASGVAGERGRGTWSGLLGLPIDRREILRAKMRGAIRPVRVLLGMMLFFYLASLATMSLHPVGFAMAATASAAFLWFGVALGTYVSVRSKSANRAIGRTVPILAAVNFAPVAALYPFVGSSSILASTPVLLTMVPMSRMQARNVSQTIALEPSAALPFLIFIGIVLAHAIGAWLLTRASAGRIGREEG